MIMMNDVVILSNVSKSFKTNNVLADINLSIPKGTIYGLLGHNGCGKTTTFRLIQGLYTVDSGKIKVFGEDPLKMNKRNIYKIGVLGEDFGLYERLSIRENIDFFGKLYNLDKVQIQERLQYYSQILKIEDKLDEKVYKLSRGMKKKIAIIRSIIHHPELLILDEPLNGLDPVTSNKFCELLKEFRDLKNMTILINSHHLDEIENLIDSYSIIKNGKNVNIFPENSSLTLKYTITISLDSVDKFNSIENEFSSNFSCIVNKNDITIKIDSVKELNQIIKLLINKDILLEKVCEEKVTLKERYLDYDS